MARTYDAVGAKGERTDLTVTVGTVLVATVAYMALGAVGYMALREPWMAAGASPVERR